MDNKQIEEALILAVVAAKKACSAILEVYQTHDVEVQIKQDNSPVTLADQNANSIIISILQTLNIPIISEEGEIAAYDVRKNWEYVWLIDPLDGTKEFIKRNGEFTVNFALIHNQKPILGVIAVPVTGELYFSTMQLGAYYTNYSYLSESIELMELIGASIRLPALHNEEGLIIVASRSHASQNTKELIGKIEKRYGKVNIISAGSSLKLCMVASGVADYYPRFTPTMEWDIAAGHAIIIGSGGFVKEASLNSVGATLDDLKYNKAELTNPAFIANKKNITIEV